MTRQVTATQAKARLLALLDDVEAGEEVEITRHGLTVAKLTPARGPHALKGRFREVAATTANDEDLYSTDSPWDLP
jgi:prevent-host-death family protein